MSECDRILENGIFNTIEVTTASTSSETLYEWLKTATYEQIMSATSAGFSISLPIEGFPIDVGADFSENDYREWREYVDSGRIRRFTESEFVSIVEKSADEGIVSAWKDCVLGKKFGLLAYEEWRKDDGTFTLTFRFVPNSIGDNYPTVSQLVVLNARCLNPLSTGDTIPYGGVSVICERTRNDNGGFDAATYILNTDKGTVEGSIPSIIVNGTPKIREVRIFHAISPSASHPAVTVNVPPEYKLIGGGGKVNWKGYGSFLTASYPSSDNTWTVSAKDHGLGSPATVEAFAIAIHDPDDEFEVKISSVESAKSQLPEAIVSAPSGFQMVGGGAKANWNGPGMLLTASCPIGSGAWLARSKAHSFPEANTVVAYAVSIRPRNGSMPPEVIVEHIKTSPSSVNSGSCSAANGTVVVGGGAVVDWVGYGNLLTASFPVEGGWSGAHKHHYVHDAATMSVYCIGIPSQALE